MMPDNDTKDSADYHYEATETVRNILKRQLLTTDLFQQTFLTTILSALDNHTVNNNSVINTWLDTLLDFIEFLPVDCLQREILPFAIERSDLSKPESLRLISCRIFGSLAPKLNAYIIKREIWPCILSLCQDESVLVRKTVCQELSKVSAFLKDNTENSKDCILLPAIVDLANNADYGVKVALLDVIVDIIPCFPTEIIVTVVVPMVKKLIDTDFNKSNFLVVAVAKNFGVICRALKDYLSFEDVSWFVNKYTDLLKTDCKTEYTNNDHTICDKPYLTIQKLCAISLTDIILLSSSDKGSTTLLIYLINYLVDLVSEDYVEIRIALVDIIKEVLVSLNDKVVLISSVLMKMLSERDIKVLKVMIPNLSFMITKMKYQEQVLKSLMLLEEYLFSQYNWRLYAEFLHQVMVLPTCYTSDQVFYVGKVMLNRLECARQKPIKEAVSTLLLTILRYNLDDNQRTLLLEHLIDHIVQNPNFYKRSFYIFICQEALNIFSTAYFKKQFFLPLLMLADDKVANVRYSLCNIIPSIVNIFKIWTEKPLVDKLIDTINKLLIDGDRTVQEQRPLLEYCNSSIGHILRSKRMSEFTETDEEDIIKFNEESRLLLLKSSERIQLDNGGVFLRSLIEEKMFSSQIDECSRTPNVDEKDTLVSKKSFMLESEFIKDTGVSINKMMEHSSKIPTPVHQTAIDPQNGTSLKEQKVSHLPVKKDRTLSPAYRSQKRHESSEHVVTRSTNIAKRNANFRGKRLSVPVMSCINVDIKKDANGNLVKFAAKRPQSCYVDGNQILLSEIKTEKSLSDESLDKNSKNKPLSRLPIRKSQGK